MSSMPRAKTTPFKTALTEHVHIVSDAKGRKVPAISILWKPDAYNTITHNAYIIIIIIIYTHRTDKNQHLHKNLKHKNYELEIHIYKIIRIPNLSFVAIDQCMKDEKCRS